MWDELKKDFNVVVGRPFPIQLFNNTEACEAITKFRNTSEYHYLGSFISLLEKEEVRRFSKSNKNIIGLIYKDAVVDYKFVSCDELVDNKYESYYTYSLPLRDSVGKKKHSFTVEVISKLPLCSPELIHCICEEKNVLAAAAVFLSISDGFKYEKQEGEPSSLEIINYLSNVERDVYSFINVEISINVKPISLKDALIKLMESIDIDKILEKINTLIDQNSERISKVGMMLRKLKITSDNNAKTRCYRKTDFSEILRVDVTNFSESKNKWCKLFERAREKTKPLRTCAEIEYDGDLFEYTKKDWNSKSNKKWEMNGLIESIYDLKELFDLGHDKFMFNRTGRTNTKPARS